MNLFDMYDADKPKQGVTEKWSQKYKSSINCSHPKGFSQKAHCVGKKKHNESVEMEMTCPDCGMCETHGDNSVNNLDEACWKGYHKEGMKTMFGKRYPNCVKNKNESLETYVNKGECPGCGGAMVSEEQISEKQDACYHKVKSRYKVWPSAYASGALVQCRKKGAANWGNSNESITQEEYDQLDENLKQWFSDKWVRFGPDGKIRGDCARGDDSEGKPKCLPQSKAHSLGKKGRASAAARKRREDPNPERSGKAINVNTKKKSNEGVAEAATDDPRFQKMMGNIQKSTPKPVNGYVAVNYASERPSKKIKGVTRNGKPIPDVIDDPEEFLNGKIGFTSDQIDEQLMKIGQKYGWDSIDPGRGQGYAELFFDTNKEYTSNNQHILAANIVGTVNEINKFFNNINRSLQTTGLPGYKIDVWQGMGPPENINQIEDLTQIDRLAKGQSAKPAAQTVPASDAGPAIGKMILKHLPSYEAENDELGYDPQDFQAARDIANIYITKGERAGLQAQGDSEVSEMIDELLSDAGASGLRTIWDLDEQGVAEVSDKLRNKYVTRASDDYGNANFAARASKDHPGLEKYNKEQEQRAKKRAAGLNRALSDKRLGKEMNEAAADQVEAYGYAYNKRDQRVMWRKIFPSAEAAYKWAESKNATVLGTKKVEQSISENRLYYNTIGTLDLQLRTEFKMRKDSTGWFLKESAAPKIKLEAHRAFGTPMLKEYQAISLGNGAQELGPDNVVSPVGSVPKNQIKKVKKNG